MTGSPSWTVTLVTHRAFAALVTKVLVTTVVVGACDAPRAPTSQTTVATLVEGCTDCGIEIQATVELQDHPDFPIGSPQT